MGEEGVGIDRSGDATVGRRRVVRRQQIGDHHTPGRPVAGANPSATCPPLTDLAPAPRITFPRAAQTFALDPDGPARQEILLTASANARSLRFVVDGVLSPELSAPFSLPLALTPGTHTVQCRASGTLCAPVTFTVLPN